MKEVLESLLIKLGMEEDLQYFDGELAEKVEYHALSKSLQIHLKLKESLPYEVWQRFYTKLMLMARSKVDLTITATQDTLTILKVREYLEHAQGIQPQLKLFEGSLPRLEEKMLVYSFADEKQRDEAIMNKHLMEAFLRKVGIPLPILVQELKTETAAVEFKKPESTAPAAVYEEKKMSFVPKTKKNNQAYVDFKIKDITEACYQIKITGEIFEKENRALRTGKHILTLHIADDEDAIVIKRFERGALTLEVLDEI